jgi:hypothetical protein
MTHCHYRIQGLPSVQTQNTVNNKEDRNIVERMIKNAQTHKFRVASRSRENAFDMGVMASFAVFSVNSSAPAMMVVSSCVKSPPFPA